MMNTTPQVEKGFIQIATGKSENDIFIALSKAQLSGTEYQCIMVVLRKTWGFKKKEDWISLSQFMNITSRSKSAVVSALNSLVRKNILVRKTRQGVSTIYRFNKSFNDWRILVRKTTLVRKLVRKTVPTSTENSTQLVRKTGHTKETITKETIQKKYTSIKSIDQTVIQEVAKKYNVPTAFVMSKLDDMTNWLEAKGRRYKDYKSALMDWVKRDALKIINSAKKHESKYIGTTKI